MVRMTQKSRRGGSRPAGGTGPGGRPGVAWSEGVIRLADPYLFVDPHSDACRDFLRRALRLVDVLSVEIDRLRGLALIRYDPEWVEVEEMLGLLTDALQGQPDREERIRLDPIPTTLGDGPTVKVSRYGSILTTWEVVHELPGRLRFRNERLGSDAAMAQKIARELAAVHGIESCRVGSNSASLLVYHDPVAIGSRQILQILDHLIEGPGLSMAHEGEPPAVRFGLTNASVGLAALGEFAFPALLPASAVLLVASNARTIRAALDEIRDRQPGLPVLTTTIITATLASGQFLAASLMGWMIKFWHHRHHEQHRATRRRLLPGMAQHRRFARLLIGDEEVEVTLERLRPRDPVSVRAGELFPADGRLIRGSAIVDERPIRGGFGLIRKGKGDLVYAGTRAVAGEVCFEVEAVGASTRAATLASAVLSASSPPPSGFAVTAHGEAFARRAVVPTLATAGLGLMVGDLTTAAAVLRPDYATGPGLGVSLEVLRDSASCAREGIVIRDASVFRRLAEADLILFDDHSELERPGLEIECIRVVGGDTEQAVLIYAAAALGDLGDERARTLRAACEAQGLVPLETASDHCGNGIALQHGTRRIIVRDEPCSRATLVSDSVSSLIIEADGRTIGRVSFRPNEHPRAEPAIRALRESCPSAVGLLSSRSEATLASLAESLGIEHFRGGLTSEAKADLLRSFRERGVKVAYVGDCRRDTQAAREAHVAISLADEFDPEGDPAPIVMLPGDFMRVAGLKALSRSHLSRVRTVYGSALVPNLICIAGAFFFGFTSLSAVIVTNLGTLGVYSRFSRRARLDRFQSHGSGYLDGGRPPGPPVRACSPTHSRSSQLERREDARWMEFRRLHQPPTSGLHATRDGGGPCGLRSS